MQVYYYNNLNFGELLKMAELRIKRIYEEASADDGYRVLVDRLWPRGISKEKAQIDIWAREIAPSAELRKWFHHEPEKYPEFCERYIKELQIDEEAASFRGMIREKLKAGNVTLLFSAKDETCNNAAALKEWLDVE